MTIAFNKNTTTEVDEVDGIVLKTAPKSGYSRRLVENTEILARRKLLTGETPTDNSWQAVRRARATKYDIEFLKIELCTDVSQTSPPFSCTGSITACLPKKTLDITSSNGVCTLERPPSGTYRYMKVTFSRDIQIQGAAYMGSDVNATQFNYPENQWGMNPDWFTEHDYTCATGSENVYPTSGVGSNTNGHRDAALHAKTSSGNVVDSIGPTLTKVYMPTQVTADSQRALCRNEDCSSYGINDEMEQLRPSVPSVKGFNTLTADTTEVEMFLDMQTTISSTTETITIQFANNDNIIFDLYKDDADGYYCVVYNYWVDVNIETT